VEVEKATSALMEGVLVENGYDVVVTRDWGGAVHVALAEKPDLILVELARDSEDPFGGGFDGFSFIAWYNRMCTEGRAAILVMTSQTAPNLQRRVLEAGAAGLFQPPFDTQQTLEAIRTTLANTS
jgi:DNA-binding response OmpR family regulator